MAGPGKRPPTAFGWKSKRQKVVQTALSHELEANLEAEEEREKSALDEWMRRQAASSVLQLEDAEGLSSRRKHEGCILAEAARFHEAAARFQAAIDLTPSELSRRTATLHELQAQCYMEVGDTYSAIRSAERAVACDVQWPDAHQTLGRAQRNLGEIELAIASFETALRLDQEGLEDLRNSDLAEAQALLARKNAMVAQADAQYLAGPLAQGREEVPEPGLSIAVRHVLGDRVCLSALPPCDLIRPPGC